MRWHSTQDRDGPAGLVPRQRRVGAGEHRTWVVFLSVMSVWWVTTSSALAQVQASWQLRFTAPPACSTAQDFREALDERVVRSGIYPGELNHRITVSILPADDGWAARLVVESSVDGVRVERTAQANRCEELIPALALMAALALELEPSATPERPPPPPTLEADLRSIPPLAPAPPKVASPLPVAAKAASSKAAPPPGGTRLTEGELGFMLHWRSVVGWRDRVAVGPGILWGSRAAQGFSPWLRVTGDRVASGVVDASGFGASLTWTLAQLDGCTHKWALSGGAFVSPCARLSVGSLQAKGFAGVDAGVDSARDSTRLWLTAGAGIEAAIPIVGPLWLRVQGGVEALVLRQRVYVDADPDRILVHMPAVLGLLGVGLGVRIW
jgi:hypothetical protein